MNLTLPSAIKVLTPPGWSLRTDEGAVVRPVVRRPPKRQTPKVNVRSFGVWIVLNIEKPEVPIAQYQPL